jgi:hypothetical protein
MHDVRQHEILWVVIQYLLLLIRNNIKSSATRKNTIYDVQLCLCAVYKEDLTNFSFTVKTFNEYIYINNVITVNNVLRSTINVK